MVVLNKYQMYHNVFHYTNDMSFLEEAHDRVWNKSFDITTGYIKTFKGSNDFLLNPTLILENIIHRQRRVK